MGVWDGRPQELRGWATSLLVRDRAASFRIPGACFAFPAILSLPARAETGCQAPCAQAPSAVHVCRGLCARAWCTLCTWNSFLPRRPCHLTAREKPVAECELSHPMHPGHEAHLRRSGPVWLVSAPLRSFQLLCCSQTLASLRFPIFTGFQFPPSVSPTRPPGPAAPHPFPAARACRLEVGERG